MTLNANKSSNFGVSIHCVLALLLLRCHTYTLLTADGFFLSGRTTRIALHCPCHPEWQQYIVYNTLNWKQFSLLVYYCCFILLLWYLFLCWSFVIFLMPCTVLVDFQSTMLTMNFRFAWCLSLSGVFCWFKSQETWLKTGYYMTSASARCHVASFIPLY